MKIYRAGCGCYFTPLAESVDFAAETEKSAKEFEYILWSYCGGDDSSYNSIRIEKGNLLARNLQDAVLQTTDVLRGFIAYIGEQQIAGQKFQELQRLLKS